jgi:hypothetical protein
VAAGPAGSAGLLGYLLDTVTGPQVAPDLIVQPAPAAPPAGPAGGPADAVPWWAERRSSTSDGQRAAREAAPAVDVRAVADLVYAALLRRQELERDRGGW